MSSGVDKKIIIEYYKKMTNEQILHALANDVKGLTMDAQEIVKEEIRRRNLNPDLIEIVELQQKTYLHVPKAYDPNGCPVEEDTRISLEKSFQFLLSIFGNDATQKRKVLTPNRIHFPIRYDGSEASALETLKVIANQMETPIEKITLDFYDDNFRKITEGSPGGLYWGQGGGGNFEISLSRKYLNEPENMVATLAHEVAHIKLLGENRLEENDERLTDMATIFFGLGVFNANAAFQTFRNSQYQGWSTSGYLTQMEWGYALSLFAYVREENQPDWANYLCANVSGDFKQAQNFILNNEDRIFI